jgi:hypothetical protein
VSAITGGSGPLGTPVSGINAGPSISAFILNASTDRMEYVFRVPAEWSGAITRVGFRQGTIVGTPGAVRCSLQGVDGSGNPDGSILAAGSAYGDYTPVSGNNNTWQWVTLGATHTPSPGDILSLNITPQGTIDGSNTASFTATFGGTTNFPYSIQNDAGSRTRGTGVAAFGYGTAGTAFGHPIATAVTQTYNSGSSPNEYALRFVVPSGWGSTVGVTGVEIVGVSAAGGVAVVTLYDGTTALQTVTLDGDALQNGSTSRPIRVPFAAASLSALTVGGVYRIGVAPQNANAFAFVGLSVAAAADLDAYPYGQAWHMSSRAGGAWTDVTTTRPYIFPILGDVTTTGGGGSLMRPVGQRGGLV